MKIHTIEHNYDYRLAGIVLSFLKAHDKSTADFETIDDMFTLLWDESEGFGRKVLEDMSNFMDDDDWNHALERQAS